MSLRWSFKIYNNSLITIISPFQGSNYIVIIRWPFAATLATNVLEP